MKRIATMILAASLLGFIGIFSKLSEMPVLSLSFFRLLLASAGIFFLVQFRKDCTLCHWKEQFSHNILGGFLIAMTFSMYVAANVIGPITNAVILLNLYPLFVMIFSWFILKEKVTTPHIITFVVAFLGLLLINPITTGVLIANALAFLAAIIYAGYVIYLRKHSISRSLSFLFWSFVNATLFTLPLAILEFFLTPFAFTTSFLWVIPLGLLSTAIPYFLFSYSLEQLSADVGASIAMIVTPLVAVIAAVILFNEIVDLKTLAGGMILIGSLVYLQFKS